jgi:hypothetical protein
MNQWFLLLHILGAITMGFYFLLPFLIGRAGKMSGAVQAGFASALRWANKIGQFGLLFEFLTGGYLISKYHYTTLWLILVLLFLIALGAVTGILGVRLKKLSVTAEAGGDAKVHQQSAAVLSTISAVFLLVIVYLMANIGAI